MRKITKEDYEFLKERQNELIKQYEYENEYENKEDETMKETEKATEVTKATEENYYERLQRLYRKDFKAGDMVFVKPKDECVETETCFPCIVFEKEVVKIREMDDDGDWILQGKPTHSHSKHWLLPVVDNKDACRAMLDGKRAVSVTGYGKEVNIVAYFDGNFRFTNSGNVRKGDDSLDTFIILDNEPAITTLTKQEIADKFGVDVKYLKIAD